jgi:hypothetical protein
MEDLSKTVAGIPVPEGVRALPVDPVRKIPVPWFVPWVDGPDGVPVPEFRAADARKRDAAIRQRRCWVCGRGLGAPGGAVAFVVGPMCTVNRVSAEPPAHMDCAAFSARACPFLSKPHMRRRSDDLPADRVGPETGVMIRRNPGCCAVWVARVYQAFRAPNSDGSVGVLFDIGSAPERVDWYAEGRAATRAEVEESVRTGVPLLRETCAGDADALAALDARVEAARVYLPA